MTTVSVVTTTYNDGQFLTRAINSVRAQTYVDYEHLIVDDGSTDDTAQIVDRYNDDRIRFVRKTANEGVARARNTGLELASGEYILYLDADDELFPNALESLVALAERGDWVAACPSYLKVWTDGTVDVDPSPARPVTSHHFYTDGMAAIGGFGGTLLATAAVKAVGAFDPRLNYAEDFDLFLRLLEEHTFHGTDEVLYLYHKGHEGQLSARQDVYVDSRRRFLEKNRHRLSRRFRANRYYRLAHAYAESGNANEAIGSLTAAIATFPVRLPYYYYLVAVSLGIQPYRTAKRVHESSRTKLRDARHLANATLRS